MTQFRSSPFGNIPEITKNLLIINGLVFFATILFDDLRTKLGLFYFRSEYFQPYQLVTHMFTHGSFFHILFNMFALFTFGSILERMWGPKRFFIFYFATGFGALALHTLVNHIEAQSLVRHISSSEVAYIKESGRQLLYSGRNGKLNQIYNIPTVGASGAIYGLLIAFAMLFPNTTLMLIFPPIPIKAKYLIPLLIVVELFLVKADFGWDNIAHFAHLGGALFGFIIVKFWMKDRRNFY
jgi:membrane associated rhomboid family serine protease